MRLLLLLLLLLLFLLLLLLLLLLLVLLSGWRICCRLRVWATSIQLAVHLQYICAAEAKTTTEPVSAAPNPQSDILRNFLL